MPNDAPSLREMVESAVNASVEEAPEVESAPVEAEQAEPVEAAPVEETEAQAEQRARDEKGRFAPKAEKPPEKPVEEKPQAKAPIAAKPAQPQPLEQPKAPETPPAKAPQSFKPAVRELASKLPAEYRPILDEAVRIDNEAKKALNDSAQARQFASQVHQSLSPYESIARANGMDAMSFAGQALQSYAAVYSGAPQQAVQVAAQVVGMLTQRFGPQALDMINQAMAGQAPQAAPAQQQPPDVNRLVEQALEQRFAAAQEQKAASAWEEFVATQPEFLDDVKDDMREILELAARQGRNMTYQQAYDRACKLSDKTAPVLESRRAADAARAHAPTVRQAKTAGSMVKAAPVVAATRQSGPRSLRDDVEAAVAAAGRT